MSADEKDRLARAALAQLGEPGDPRVAALVAEAGAERAGEWLTSDRDDLLGEDFASRSRFIDPALLLERAQRQGIRFVVPGDDEWPPCLDDLAGAEPLQERGGPPVGLWVKGPLRLDELTPGVSIVGSRSATMYGVEVAADLAAAAGRAGLPVLSGAAYGIDQAAHRGALAVDGGTAAVLACGVDRAYPAAHRSLLRHLASEGAVISESAPGWAPTQVRFLSRNRLIAALTGGTVVVEAAIRSGALNTANWADRLSRTLMGVPGPVTSAPSQGVHQLIRAGAAVLVSCGEEMLECVGAVGTHLMEVPRAPARPRDRLTVRHRQVLDAVPVLRGAAVDSIARAAGIGVLEVRSALTALQGHGLVQVDEAGWRLAEAARR